MKIEETFTINTMVTTKTQKSILILQHLLICIFVHQNLQTTHPVILGSNWLCVFQVQFVMVKRVQPIDVTFIPNKTGWSLLHFGVPQRRSIINVIPNKPQVGFVFFVTCRARRQRLNSRRGVNNVFYGLSAKIFSQRLPTKFGFAFNS